MPRGSDTAMEIPPPTFVTKWLLELQRQGLKYFVLKSQDFLLSLKEDEAQWFNSFLKKHEQYRLDHGKTDHNKYWIINRDEPWADEIKAVMEKHLGSLKD